jgi:hypothetical protein
LSSINKITHETLACILALFDRKYNDENGGALSQLLLVPFEKVFFVGK